MPALLLLISGTSFAQVQNAADADAGVAGISAIAPGSQAYVNDPPQRAVWPAFNGASVSVRPVGSSNADSRADCFPATQNGIYFLVPPDTPLKERAQLIYNQTGQLTQSTSVFVVSSNLALYRGSVRPMNINASGSTANGLANPAQPDQTVEIEATEQSAIPQFPAQVILGGVRRASSARGPGGWDTAESIFRFRRIRRMAATCRLR